MPRVMIDDLWLRRDADKPDAPVTKTLGGCAEHRCRLETASRLIERKEHMLVERAHDANPLAIAGELDVPVGVAMDHQAALSVACYPACLLRGQRGDGQRQGVFTGSIPGGVACQGPGEAACMPTRSGEASRRSNSRL